jgi:hypothetical protein
MILDRIPLIDEINPRQRKPAGIFLCGRTRAIVSITDGICYCGCEWDCDNDFNERAVSDDAAGTMT